MILYVYVKNPSTWSGEGKPKVGDLLLMHNPVFGNDDYTRHYKGLPKDTVYIVVSAIGSLIIRPVTSKDVYRSFQSFTCPKGFDKNFKPYYEEKGTLKGLTIY